GGGRRTGWGGHGGGGRLYREAAGLRNHLVSQRINPRNQAIVEPVDRLVQRRDLGAEAGVDTVDFVVERGDLRIEASIDAVDFRAQPAVDAVNFGAETHVHAGDLLVEADDPLIEHTNVPADRVQFGRDDVLERRLDLVVNAHPAPLKRC